MSNILNSFKETWITDKIDESTIAFLEKFGFYLCDKKDENDRYAGRNAVTTSQLRNMYSEVKRIEQKIEDEATDWKTDFLMLRPKIAYNVARVLSKARESRIKDFREVIEKAHSAVRTTAHFDNFVKIFEGIIAYHKVYGAKD